MRKLCRACSIPKLRIKWESGFKHNTAKSYTHLYTNAKTCERIMILCELGKKDFILVITRETGWHVKLSSVKFLQLLTTTFVMFTRGIESGFFCRFLSAEPLKFSSTRETEIFPMISFRRDNKSGFCLQVLRTHHHKYDVCVSVCLLSYRVVSLTCVSFDDILGGMRKIYSDYIPLGKCFAWRGKRGLSSRSE